MTADTGSIFAGSDLVGSKPKRCRGAEEAKEQEWQDDPWPLSLGEAPLFRNAVRDAARIGAPPHQDRAAQFFLQSLRSQAPPLREPVLRRLGALDQSSSLK